MRIVLTEYLASLRERNGLDVLVPDLVSTMGLKLLTRPEVGTRQHGVDIAAVGRLDGEPQSVYLFTIKPGNVTRQDWVSDSPQSLRNSIKDILDAYVPHKIPIEHRKKPIVVCVCIGGRVSERVTLEYNGFLKGCERGRRLKFRTWNGDDLAQLIEAHFMREDLLRDKARSLLRKTLALLDAPDAACQHFAKLLQEVTGSSSRQSKRLMGMRQLYLCSSVVLSWATDGAAIESAYLSAEISLMRAWEVCRRDRRSSRKKSNPFERTFEAVFGRYLQATEAYLDKCILPHASKPHVLSSLVRSANHVDVNLRLFDIVGRLGLAAIWTFWLQHRCKGTEFEPTMLKQFRKLATSLAAVIRNNEALWMPLRDDHVIDITLALIPLVAYPETRRSAIVWLEDMVERMDFAYATNSPYPTIIDSYPDLLAHPVLDDPDYRSRATAGSALHPMMALWSVFLGREDLYKKLYDIQKQELPLSSYQVWYLDSEFEDTLLSRRIACGRTLCGISLDTPPADYVNVIFKEADVSRDFEQLPSVSYGWWPLVAVVCRHRRFPIPVQLLRNLRPQERPEGQEVTPPSP